MYDTEYYLYMMWLEKQREMEKASQNAWRYTEGPAFISFIKRMRVWKACLNLFIRFR
jgi:hypothetical protein